MHRTNEYAGIGLPELESLRGSCPAEIHWFIRVVIDWFLIVVSFLAIKYSGSVLATITAIVVIGARQHALAILGHDGGHGHASRNRKRNDRLTCLLCLWPLGFGLTAYRRFHFAHHRLVGTEEDPELKHKHHPVLGQWRTPISKTKFIFLIVLDFLGGGFPHLLMLAQLAKPVTWADRLGPLVLIGSAIWVSWWYGNVWVPLVWFGAMGSTFFAAFRLRVWSEHVGTHGTHRVRKPNAVCRFLVFPHNTWCHYEHHRNTSIPCWQLPAVRRGDTRTLRTIFATFWK